MELSNKAVLELVELAQDDELEGELQDEVFFYMDEKVESIKDTLHVDIIACIASSDLEVDGSYIDFRDVESIDDAEGLLEEYGTFQVEVIYYSNAMKYLSEHDPSLSESMDLLLEQGYEINDSFSFSSELLASVHASHKARENFDNISSEIDDLIAEAVDELAIYTR